jgi:hypothetical protein
VFCALVMLKRNESFGFAITNANSVPMTRPQGYGLCAEPIRQTLAIFSTPSKSVVHNLARHCEPIGCANAYAIERSNHRRHRKKSWIASSQELLAMTVGRSSS